MRKYLTVSALILALFAVALVRARIHSPYQEQNTVKNGRVSPGRQKATTDADFESQFPITEYLSSRHATTLERKQRLSAERRYNKGQLPVREDSDRIITHLDWEVGLPALPVSQSQAVVSGRVVTAQAQLTNDKAVVYSEFVIQVDEVFKDNDNAFTPGIQVYVTRSGGRVRFPSGHLTLQAIAGQNMPRIGESYVFFLTRENQEEGFHILTGYIRRAGRVYPLDNPGGGKHPIATTYNATEEEIFLKDLRTALINPPRSSTPTSDFKPLTSDL